MNFHVVLKDNLDLIDTEKHVPQFTGGKKSVLYDPTCMRVYEGEWCVCLYKQEITWKATEQSFNCSYIWVVWLKVILPHPPS